ncbi:DUF1631 family protein [uncultured Pseudoteredinibacter sp.]|uniref:DUF1631 family protein n=1 Tax=uncultured Pseudoteredinibacter sp. TaxID=1641701 RepID=UPI00263A0E6B|nr:DUF1631 family protein [uncultured Pseudoteredinibacter sp.]
MSNLSNDKSATSAISPFTSAQIKQLLERCRDIVVEHAGPRLEECLESLDEQLLEFATDAPTDAEQMQYFDVQRDFRKRSASLVQLFGECLAGCFIKFSNGQLNTQTGEEKFSRDMLSLVDNEDLEETIAISSINHAATDNFGESLWLVAMRFGQLRGGKELPPEQNPVSPVQFCESLRQTLQAVACATKIKILCYRTFSKIFIPVLDDIYQELNQYLGSEGVLPELSYATAMAAGHAGEAVAPADEVLGESFEDVFDEAVPQELGNAPVAGNAAGAPANGLAPAPGQQVRLPVSGFAPQASAASPDPSMPSPQYQQSLVNAIRVLQNHLATDSYRTSTTPAASFAQVESPSNNKALIVDEGYSASWKTAAVPSETGFAPARSGATVFSGPQLLQALQNLQVGINSGEGKLIRSEELQADSDQLQIQSVAQVSQQLSSQLLGASEEEGQAVDVDDMQIIDLVGMLFDYMLSDDNLPNSVKALLSYLHTPFLKIAFIDPDFFEQTDHPARLLLNSLAEAGTRWVSNDGTAQYDIYPRIKAVVSRVLEEFQNDVRLFAELLLEFSGYTKKIARRQDLIERRAMEKVQGEEKLREVKLQVNEQVSMRIENTELPSAVLLLLLQPWSDYLVFVLLRFGKDSEEWQLALTVVDDVIWTVQPKEQEQDKARQMEMHDGLYEKLSKGFDTIAYDQTKANKLLDALFTLQKMALQSQPLQFAPEPMRSKLETMAAEKAGAQPDDEDVSEEELRMVDSLKMIEFGTWFEFSDGKRLKVAWYNSTTLHYMLVDQLGKKVDLKTGLELARDMLSGEAKVISGATKPFFERALENIFQSLNAKAETNSQQETTES